MMFQTAPSDFVRWAVAGKEDGVFMLQLHHIKQLQPEA